MAIVTDRANLPEAGDVVKRIDIADDGVADIYFESGKVVFAHYSPFPDQPVKTVVSS